MRCRICNNIDIKKFLSLGNIPLTNSFVSESELNKEEKAYPLDICFCPTCKLVQLNSVVSPKLLFKYYLYISSVSSAFKLHLTRMAESLANEFNLNENSLVVDIGSNDGLLLKGFNRFGVKTIGVEPATNIAEIARREGVETINDFFNESTAKQIIDSKGKADVITANNVFAHINDLGGVIKNVKTLLKDNGIFVIEVAYLLDMLQQLTFDLIYHEHLFYYSLTPLNYLFKKNGMEIFKVEHVSSQGGSLRVFIKKESSSHQIEKSVSSMLEKEKAVGIHDYETYEKFADRVHASKEKLVKCLKDIKNSGKTIVAYGAPAKATILLSFCNIGRGYIDYVVDNNALKQGLFTPHSHIPIVAPSMLDEKRPDYVLILAWNFAEEILNSTKKYAAKGTKFIIPLPEPVVI